MSFFRLGDTTIACGTAECRTSRAGGGGGRVVSSFELSGTAVECGKAQHRSSWAGGVAVLCRFFKDFRGSGRFSRVSSGLTSPTRKV